MGKNKMIVRLTESELNGLVEKAVKKALRINEGTTDQRVMNTIFDACDNMSGRDVAEAIFNWLDSGTLEKIARWLIEEEYIDDAYGLLGGDEEEEDY